MGEKLHGVVPILPMPFTADGSDIEENDLRRMIDVLIDEGVHGIALLGVASEFYKVSDEERRRAVEIAVEQAAGRVPVVVNVTRHALELAVEDARHAQAIGAGAVMVVPPFLMSPSAEAIGRHLFAVAESVDLPIVVQYAPEVTGVGIPADIFVELANRRAAPVYAKIESVPPGPLVSALIEKTDGKLGVFIGNSGRQMIDALRRGAVGVMPGASMAKIYVDIYEDFRRGEMERALERFERLLPIINHCSQTAESLIKYEKILLTRRGVFSSDRCRSPSFEPDGPYLQLFEKFIARLKEAFGYPNVREGAGSA